MSLKMNSFYFKKNLTICTLYNLQHLKRADSVEIKEGLYVFNDLPNNKYQWIHKKENDKFINKQTVSIDLDETLLSKNYKNTEINNDVLQSLFCLKNAILADFKNNKKNTIYSKNIITDNKSQLEYYNNNDCDTVSMLFFLNETEFDISTITLSNKIQFGSCFVNHIKHNNVTIGYVVSAFMGNCSNNESKLTYNLKNYKDIIGFGIIDSIYTNFPYEICNDESNADYLTHNTIGYIKYCSKEFKTKNIKLTTEETSKNFLIGNKVFNIIEHNKTDINYKKYFQLKNKQTYNQLFSDFTNSPILVNFDLFKNNYNIHVIVKIKNEFVFRSKDVVKERSSTFSKNSNNTHSSIILTNKNSQFLFIMLSPFLTYNDNFNIYDEFDFNRTNIIYLNLVLHFKDDEFNNFSISQSYLNNFVKYLSIKKYKILFNKITSSEHVYILTNKNNIQALEFFNKKNVSKIKLINIE